MIFSLAAGTPARHIETIDGRKTDIRYEITTGVVMVAIRYITPNFAVAPILRAGDHIRLKARGFRSVISNLPDAEIPAVSGPDGALEYAINAEGWREQFTRIGLGFAHLPVANHDVFDPAVLDSFERHLLSLPGPVLAHCKSGTRSALLWTMAAARHEPLEMVIAAAGRAGFDFGFLSPEIKASALVTSANRSATRAHSLCLDCPAAA